MGTATTAPPGKTTPGKTTRRTTAALLAAAVAALALAALALPASAAAARITLGPPLTKAASVNTVDGIAPSQHAGADAAIWNTGPRFRVPRRAQVLRVRLEGCAAQASGGPSPLQEVHFQTLTTLPSGAFRVFLTSSQFAIPICGQGGASPSTISTYAPYFLCAPAGGYVALNEAGGFVPGAYPHGVPYVLLGHAAHASIDSFIRNNGTNNGDSFTPNDRSPFDGFGHVRNEQLLMQVTLGTGRNAAPSCR